MISVNILGGLGNQLFQICAMIAYCINTNREFILPYIKLRHADTDRPTYWNSMFDGLEKYTNVNKPEFSNEIILRFHEQHYCQQHNNAIHIDPSIDNVLLSGYFQSYLYFKNEYPRIYEMLDIDNKKTIITHPQIDNKEDERPSISIHFRLGDYVFKKCCHPVLPLDYYQRSIQYIIDTVPNSIHSRIFVFFEQADYDYVSNAVDQFKTHFPNTVEFILMEPEDDWKQLIFMSKCDHHIIANSTFSWWGAVLSRNTIDETTNDKVICYPSIWYGHILHFINIRSLFPTNWKQMDAHSDNNINACNCY